MLKTAKALPEWNQIRKFPVRMYQTIRGPIMGHAEIDMRSTTRLWAPAHVGSPELGKVAYVPLEFCEEYLDLRVDSAAVFGSNPVPDVVLTGYTTYVDEFMRGSYRMAPVTARIGVDACQVEIRDSRIPEPAPVAPNTSPCGSCGKPQNDHADDCAVFHIKVRCANCNHPGHLKTLCGWPLDVEGDETCPCDNYVPKLESIGRAPLLDPVTLGSKSPSAA